MHKNMFLNTILLIFMSSPMVFISSLLANEANEIQWQKWHKSAFEQAKRENKMILLNVGIEVCYACNWMEEGTYSNPRIAKKIMKNFIPIQVDANARPDLGERYSDWAWPATIFMDPKGTQVLALRGSRRPDTFEPVLDTLIRQHAENALQPDKLAPYAAPEKPETSELTVLRDRIRRTLDDDYDDKNAGWGDELKEINGFGRLEQLFMRAFVGPDAISKRRAVDMATAMIGRIDPVWGGFYPAGESGWKDPIAEKRTGSDATAMMAFASAYQLTKDKKFLDAAHNIDRFLRNWMMSEEGSFYTSQEAESKALPENMSPADYFRLDTDEKRRAFGVPEIDHTVYTDLNSRVIKAYVELYEASENKKYLQTAIRAANAIIRKRLQPKGWVTQVEKQTSTKSAKRIHILNVEKRPILRTQAEFGVAILSLYRATGKENWLQIAINLADITRELLEDPVLGGFYATTSEDTDDIAKRRKPLQDNGVAARFFYQLGRYTKEPTYEKSAEKAIRATVSDEILNREGRIIGSFAVALETITSGYVEYSVVGDRYDPAANKLFGAARSVYDPRKILHYESPGRYPDLGRAALYICNPTACSIPIFTPKEIHHEAGKFIPLS